MSQSKFLSELTDMEKLVVSSFIIDFNVINTGKRLGKSRNQIGRYLERSQVRNAIDEETALASQYANVNLERVIVELGKIAFFNIKKHVKKVNWDISKVKDGYFPVEMMDFGDMDGAVIKDIEVKDLDGVPYVKFTHHDKMKALSLLTEILQTRGEGILPPPKDIQNIEFEEVQTNYFKMIGQNKQKTA